MAKKNDIQKLKDLFIQYHWEWVYGIIEPEHWIYLEEAMKARAPYIISKQYWFIKWLVENEKINFEWMSWHWKIISYLTEKKDYKWNDVKEWVVLMLLSIQDEPIEFLVSILK